MNEQMNELNCNFYPVSIIVKFNWLDIPLASRTVLAVELKIANPAKN